MTNEELIAKMTKGECMERLGDLMCASMGDRAFTHAARPVVARLLELDLYDALDEEVDDAIEDEWAEIADENPSLVDDEEDDEEDDEDESPSLVATV